MPVPAACSGIGDVSACRTRPRRGAAGSLRLVSREERSARQDAPESVSIAEPVRLQTGCSKSGQSPRSSGFIFVDTISPSSSFFFTCVFSNGVTTRTERRLMAAPINTVMLRRNRRPRAQPFRVTLPHDGMIAPHRRPANRISSATNLDSGIDRLSVSLVTLQRRHAKNIRNLECVQPSGIPRSFSVRLKWIKTDYPFDSAQTRRYGTDGGSRAGAAGFGAFRRHYRGAY